MVVVCPYNNKTQEKYHLINLSLVKQLDYNQTYLIESCANRTSFNLLMKVS